MGLVIKNGKLLVKEGGLATATRPSEACDCCNDAETGRCCVYTGDVLDMACGQTRRECTEDAERIAATDPTSFWSEDFIEFDNDPEADCPYSVFVYHVIPEANTPICWDEDEDGNPVTDGFCEAYCDGLEDTLCVFTAGANCGGDNSGTGTCPSAPPDQRSNPLP